MAILEGHNLTVSTNGTLPRVPFLALKEKILGKNYVLSIAFVTPKKAQALNILHRGKDYIPNTLSFPLTKTSGEIVLCASAIKKEYASFDMKHDHYLIFILIHSMLHLKGFDHGSTMERKEKHFLKLFTPHTNEAKRNRRN
jgi:rRNA maturation RNase YbeY